MALVLGGIFSTGFHHDDIDRTAWITRAAGPPFLTVEHIVITIPDAAQAQIRRIRRGHIRLSHHIGGADLPGQQWRKPAGFHLFSAISLEDFHIARVRRGTVEHLCGQR